MCQFHTVWSHFWRLMVTIDYDGVSTHLMIILMIELGIWVLLACANFGCNGGIPDHSTAIENICGATCISGANYFK